MFNNLYLQYASSDFSNEYYTNGKNENTIISYRSALYENNLQKKALEEIINNLITAKQLPYRLFRDRCPLIAKLANAKNKIHVVFESFRLISENISEEFGPRLMWQKLDTYKSKNMKGVTAKISTTQCGATQAVLETSLFGSATIQKGVCVSEIINMTSILNRNPATMIRLAAETHIKRLQFESPSVFYAYSLGITNKDTFPGHGFIMIQHLDSKGHSLYHLFQSYVYRYTLNDYIKGINNTWDQLTFDVFLTGLESCFSSEKWTAANDEFYRKYFYGHSNITIDSNNPFLKTQVSLTYTKRNIIDFAELNEKFQDSKKTFIYPVFKNTTPNKNANVNYIMLCEETLPPFFSEVKVSKEIIPKLLIIEGDEAGAGMCFKYKATHGEHITIGTRLLESFSEEELSHFYDLYWPLIRDGMKIFLDGKEISCFPEELRKSLSDDLFQEDSEYLSDTMLQNIAQVLNEALRYDEEKQRFCLYDSHFIFQMLKSLVSKYELKEILVLSDQDLSLFFENFLEEQKIPSFINYWFSKQETIALFFYRLLSKFMNQKEIQEEKHILLDEEMVFPFVKGAKIDSLERLIFILFSHFLSNRHESPLQAMCDYSHQVEHLQPFISIGLNLGVLKLQSANLSTLWRHIYDFDISSLILKSSFILKKYPHLKSVFFSSILIPISMHSTFTSSKKLTPDQIQQLKNYRDCVLELYLTYFKDVDENSLSTEPGKDAVLSYPYTRYFDPAGKLVLEILESIGDSPELFSKLVKFQLESMKDQLSPSRLEEDTKKGKLCFLPNVDANTPFGLLRKLLVGKKLKVVVNNARNYREFILIMNSLINRNFFSFFRNEKFTEEHYCLIIEKCIKNYIHEHIDLSLIDEIYEEIRLMASDTVRKTFILKTGIPDILFKFASTLRL